MVLVVAKPQFGSTKNIGCSLYSLELLGKLHKLEIALGYSDVDDSVK